MLLGVGIDILSIERFSAVLSRRSPSALARRICGPRELAEWREKFAEGSAASLPRSKASSAGHETADLKQLRFLSARWALKEAAYKALSPLSSRQRLSWSSLDLRYLPSGQPELSVLPPVPTSTSAPNGLEGVQLLCSLSHDAGVVVGVVIAQKTP